MVEFASKLTTALSKVLIYGASAGAIVRGHDIELAQVGPEADENTADLRDLNALDFLDSCNVYAHSILDQSQVGGLLQKTRSLVHSPQQESGSIYRQS